MEVGPFHSFCLDRRADVQTIWGLFDVRSLDLLNVAVEGV